MNNPDQPHFHERQDESDSPQVFTGTAEYLQTCSLVLSAVGINHSIDPDKSTLTVPAPYSDAARHQLELYFQENTGWPERSVPTKTPVSTEKPPTLLLIGGLAIFFLVTGSWQDNAIWFGSGAIDSKAILEQGQWWRLVTALTLHADPVHLLGNCVIGGFLVHMLCKTIGSGLGWFSLLFCGALGNFLNILLRGEVHHSVGFSTSIFAAIGLFSGLQLFTSNKTLLKELLIPLGAGAGLLAMLGTEGERTDIGAHFFGFACGLAFGFFLNRFDINKIALHRRLQQTLFMLSLLVIILSWMVA